MTACALFGGPVLTYRAFKQSAPRNIRGVANSAAIRGLEEAGVGKVCSVQIPSVTNPVTGLKVYFWLWDHLCNQV